MKKAFLVLFALLTAMGMTAQDNAGQIKSNASFMKVRERGHVQVPFRYTDEGVATPIEWGMDLAWTSEGNLRTGIWYAGKEVVDIVRVSFQPTYSVESGNFASAQTRALKNRVNLVKKYCKENVALNINCDHPSLDEWYDDQTQTSLERAARWVKVIDMSADYYKANGLTNLVSISPLNEPDYEWHPLTTFKNRKADFKAMCQIFKEDPAYKDKYENVRMCGGNTLNNDQAYSWWSYMNPYIDEGNTHQLAGSFNTFASFFEKVRAAGQHATDDELHNVMEAMVGVEYGMQTGIWWGTAEHTRGQFMKATWQGNPGKRLGYGEHRDNWTAASVYRHANGQVQGFAGSSERQAMKTTFEFIGLDRPVWYAGQRGREFPVTIYGPTTPGYQSGQTNGETLIDIQSGEDIMPYIAMKKAYKIMNVMSGKILGFNATPSGWTQATLRNNSADSFNQWALDSVGVDGDNSYFLIHVANSNTQLDVYNWSTSAGANVGGMPNGGKGGCEHWYLQYAGDGSFYIRARQSTLCLEANGSTGTGTKLQAFSGEDQQKWRFIAVDAVPDLEAPEAVPAVSAKAQSASVLLEWDESPAEDLKSYTVLRSEDGVEFYTIANELTDTKFIDNETEGGKTYTYKVVAEDGAYNRSAAVASQAVQVPTDRAMITNLVLQNSLLDATENGNHCATYADPKYTLWKEENCLELSGTDNFIKLPYTVASSDELTIATWVYYRGGTTNQHLLDFTRDDDHYMYLTPNSGSRMKFVMKNGGVEQTVTVKNLSVTKWSYLVVTIGAEGAKVYVNGELQTKTEKYDTDIKPSDIKPVLNFIGRSKNAADPLFKGFVHDFQMYNYALTADEIVEMYNEATSINEVEGANASGSKSKSFDLSGRAANNQSKGVIIKDNKKFIKK